MHDYRDIQRQHFTDQVRAGRYHAAARYSPAERQFMLRVFAAACHRWNSSDHLSVLDCGMGSGPALQAVVESRAAPLTVSGFDLTPAMVTECQTRLARLRAPFEIGFLNVGDITDPASYGSQLHDLVFCVYVIQQLPSALRSRAIGCMVAAATPGGCVVVVDRERHSWYGIKMGAKKAATRWLGVSLVPKHFLAAHYPCLRRLARYSQRRYGSSTAIYDDRRGLYALVIHPAETAYGTTPRASGRSDPEAG